MSTALIAPTDAYTTQAFVVDATTGPRKLSLTAPDGAKVPNNARVRILVENSTGATRFTGFELTYNGIDYKKGDLEITAIGEYIAEHYAAHSDYGVDID